MFNLFLSKCNCNFYVKIELLEYEMCVCVWIHIHKIRTGLSLAIKTIPRHYSCYSHNSAHFQILLEFYWQWTNCSHFVPFLRVVFCVYELLIRSLDTTLLEQGIENIEILTLHTYILYKQVHTNMYIKYISYLLKYRSLFIR